MMLQDRWFPGGLMPEGEGHGFSMICLGGRRLDEGERNVAFTVP